MPFLRFKGFDSQFLREISPELVEDFSQLAQVSKEKVKVESIQVEVIANSPLSVEIYMFPREQSKHDAIAKRIHDLLSKHGYTQVHIFFVLLSPSLYYREGQPVQQIPFVQKT